MKKQAFDGQLRRQCLSLPSLCQEQIAGLRMGLAQTIPVEELKNIRRVILTGCGDSYLAGIAGIPAFKNYASAFANDFRVERCINVGKTLQLTPQQAASTLLVVISASGSAARIEEALLRGRHCGCKTLLVTNDPNSRGAKAADYTLLVNTPDFGEPGPGLRNYYASVSALFALAAYLGIAKGYQGPEAQEELFQAIAEYTAEFGKIIDTIDDQVFKIALAWRDSVAIESIGDHTDYASAYFVSAKVVEAVGLIATTTNTEDWCHVNYFARNPKTIGTVVVSSHKFNNLGRVKETLRSAEAIGRPVLLITTGTGKDYEIGPGVEVCSLPECPEKYAFLTSLINFVPGSILASYLAALHDEPYFRAEDSVNKTSSIGHTLRTSQMEIN